MKTAIIFGSSGLVGSTLLNQLINNSNYSKIKIFVRSSPDIINPKVEIINTDFNNLEKYKNLINGDDCFVCIGTTKKNSPNKNDYRRVELDLPIQIAQISKSNLTSAGFEVFGALNAPYAWIKTPKNMSSWDFFDFLLENANVVGTPGSGFGAAGEGYFRLSAFNSRENVEKAMQRIVKS